MLSPVFAALAFAAAAAEPAALSIRVSGARSDAGQVLIAVYRGADGFPGGQGKAFTTAVTRVTGGGAQVEVAVPPGEYAVAVVHDENGNGVFDTNWLGIPKEGFGVSNDATRRFGPPRYREAKFTVPASGAVQRIALVYF